MKTMYLLFAALVFLMLAGTLRAADLAWDYDEQHELTQGFTVYFTDGTEDYNYTFPANEAVVEGGMVKWGPIEDRLNLNPGVEYTFNLSRYNATGTSGIEGQTPVSHEVGAYVPPTDRLPDAPALSPGQAGGLKIE